MKIQDKLASKGFNESLIKFAHSRTRNKNSSILHAFLVGENEGTYNVKLELSCGRMVCYDLNLARLRQKKLNLFLQKG